MKLNYKWLIAFAPLFIACEIEDVNDDDYYDIYENGVFISNEGPFQGGNGTLCFYDPSTGQVTNDVFSTEVGRPLGNIVHSLLLNDDELYIVVHNSGVVEVVELDDEFESEETIMNLTSPRYVQTIEEDIVAITDWGTNTVEIHNVETESRMASLAVGNGPERMLVEGSRLYVANSGGFGLDSTVMMIDISTRTVVDTFYVGYNPNSMVRDINGDLWVLCGGYTDWQNSANNKAGSLYKIDPITGAVLDYFDFSASPRPTGLSISSSDQTLYFLDNGYGGDVYAMDIYETTLPSTAMLTGVNGYSIGVNRSANELYITDPVDFASQGRVYRYDLIDMMMIDTLNVGIIPGNVVFN